MKSLLLSLLSLHGSMFPISNLVCCLCIHEQFVVSPFLMQRNKNKYLMSRQFKEELKGCQNNQFKINAIEKLNHIQTSEVSHSSQYHWGTNSVASFTFVVADPFCNNPQFSRLKNK